MFYEESVIKNLLKCNQCSDEFDEKNFPKALPCNKIICSKCELKLTQDSLNGCFKCELCLQNHIISKNSFILNELVFKLSQIQPKHVKFNRTSESTKLFYKESIVLELLKCNLCKYSFDVYDAPVILLCGKSICLNCFHKQDEKSKIKTIFKCMACNNEHKMLENLIQNEFVIELFSIKPIELQRNKECNELKLNLKKLEDIVKELDFLSENGDFTIRDYCDEQRRQVQLSSEMQQLNNELNDSENIEEDQFYKILIDIIDDYENECIKTYSNKKDLKMQIKEMTKETCKFIEKTELYLSDYDIDDNQIEISNELCASIIVELNQELENIKGELFNNEMIKYNSNINTIEFEPISFVIKI